MDINTKIKANRISGILFIIIGIISLIVFVYQYKTDYIIYSIVVVVFGIFKYYEIDNTQYDLNAGMNEKEGFWNKY